MMGSILYRDEAEHRRSTGRLERFSRKIFKELQVVIRFLTEKKSVLTAADYGWITCLCRWQQVNRSLFLANGLLQGYYRTGKRFLRWGSKFRLRARREMGPSFHSSQEQNKTCLKVLGGKICHLPLLWSNAAWFYFHSVSSWLTLNIK